MSVQSPIDLSTNRAHQLCPLLSERNHRLREQRFDLLHVAVRLMVGIDGVFIGM